MKVGIYSPYLDSLGGGERYILTIAEFFLKKGDRVDIFWDKPGDLKEMSARFGLDLTDANFVANPFSLSLLKKLEATAGYDLIIVLSDGSIPLSRAKRNWIHLQVPFQISNRPKIVNKLKLKLYEKVICNSKFTKTVIDKTYGSNSTVLYPPVDVENFKVMKKEQTIMTAGRFFQAAHLKNFAPKKQGELINAFKKLIHQGLTSWKFILIGAYNPDLTSGLSELKVQAKGLPIDFEINASYEKLRETFSKSSIYWHAAGFGEDLTKHPERAEHFGITTVESMAAGAVPVVFAGGGQLEIVEEGKTGFFWITQDELLAKTQELVKNKKLLAEVSKAAIAASKKFSKGNFYRGLEKLLS